MSIYYFPIHDRRCRMNWHGSAVVAWEERTPRGIRTEKWREVGDEGQRVEKASQPSSHRDFNIPHRGERNTSSSCCSIGGFRRYFLVLLFWNERKESESRIAPIRVREEGAESCCRHRRSVRDPRLDGQRPVPVPARAHDHQRRARRR